jgi:hypothetical protein
MKSNSTIISVILAFAVSSFAAPVRLYSKAGFWVRPNFHPKSCLLAARCIVDGTAVRWVSLENVT